MSRLASLKARLAELRYNQPLGLESAPLVERLLDDLVQSQHQQAELASLTDKRGDELGVAEQHVLPVRKENTRLVRENNELHMQLIADAEAAAKARDELSAANTKLLSQNADLRFIASQQQSRLDSLQSENENLRSRFHEALEQNGIVLPSGTSHLHKQLDGANARLSALSEELRSLRTAKEMRDAEVSRLQARAHAKEADPMLSVAHVNEEKNLTIAQLNHQVDYLNARMVEQDSELEHAREAEQQASAQAERMERLMGAEEKDAVEGKLHAAISATNEARAKGKAAIAGREEAEAALAVAARDARSFAERAARMQMERDALETRADALTAEVDSASAALTEFEHADSTMRAQLRSLQAECEALQASGAGAKAIVDELRTASTVQRDATSNLQTQLMESDDERASLQRERAHLSELLRAERAACAAARAEFERADSDGQAAIASEAALRQALDAERETAMAAAQAARQTEAEKRALQHRMVEYEETTRLYTKAVAALEEQRKAASDARAELQSLVVRNERSENEIKVHAREADEAARGLHASKVERDQFAAALAAAEAQLREVTSSARRVEDEKTRLAAAVVELKGQLAADREASLAQALEVERQQQLLRRGDEELADTRERLAFEHEEERRHAARADELSGQLETLRAALDDTRARLDAECEARRAEVSAREDALRTADEEREAHKSVARSSHDIQRQLDRAADALGAREGEVAQLKSLVGRMEMAHSEISSKLEERHRKLDEVQSALRAEGDARTALASELTDSKSTARQLRELVSSLDAERDALSGEVDARAEEAMSLKQAAERAAQHASEVDHQLIEAREQVGQQAKLLASLEATRSTLQSRLEAGGRAEAAFRTAAASNEEELDNVSADLRKMIHENQIVNDELQKAARLAERSRDESRRLEARTAQLEASVEAGAEEKEEMLRSYRKQAEEVSAAHLSLATLCGERDSLRAQLSLLEEGYGELQRQSARVQGENAQLLLDLHAFEQQSDALVQQLHQSDGQFRHAAAEKQAAEEQLVSTKMVLGGMERSREVIQRDSAGASRQLASMRAQLEEVAKEREILSQQLALARSHVSQLEGVTTELRVQMSAQAQADSAAPAVGMPASVSSPAEADGYGGGVSGSGVGADGDGAHAPSLIAEVGMLRQQVKSQGTEVHQLQRALGTATAERDAADLLKAEQLQTLERLKKTVASQSEVIRTLDEERAAAAAGSGAVTS